LKARCQACGDIVARRVDLSVGDSCAACGASGRLRPHVVWFGEMPFALDRIDAALLGCALFLSIGTSGAVYPAAGFVQQVRLCGRAHTAELNKEPSKGATLFAEARYGPATEVVPAYVEKILRMGW
jgi:NAD-dependent deacetylase